MHWIGEVWHYLVAGLTILAASAASSHAILYKRDSRAAVLWVGFIWLVPLLGGVLYFVLGVNRIRRQALFLRSGLDRRRPVALEAAGALERDEFLTADGRHLQPLKLLADRVVKKPLVGGNEIEVLVNGEEAYAAMLEAMAGAQESISLATYIFDNDSVGRRFVEALAQAQERGVEARVIIDATGARYSWPTTIAHRLRRAGVPAARFLRAFFIHPMSVNLRNHRKICVIDGRVGFTGGMNIRQGHLVSERPRRAVQDLQFRLRGPVVAQLQETFADDWFFCTGETLGGERWFPELASAGPALARGIPDGPDEDFETLRWAIMGALACAERSVTVMTPYFLPDQSVIAALNVAAMRGVEVNILLPEKSNLPYVHWAIFAILWQVLERGCRVWLTPPPFDHSKMMLVDGHWALIGSGNWDPRSFRLNFEFNVEIYGKEAVSRLEKAAEKKWRGAREIRLADVDGRSLPVRFRDGVARLLIPFL